MISQYWACDFEFGAGPTPRCLVARELVSHTLVRVWEDELLRLRTAPFTTGPSSCVVAYYASAELGCFLALSWPLPTHVVDLFAEFRVRTNGRPPTEGNSLLGALAHFKLPAIGAAEKEEMRELALRGGPWAPGEPQALLDYCQTDVESLALLWPHLRPSAEQLPYALLRGRYMASAAKVEQVGVPLDVPRLHQLRAAWPRLKRAVIQAANARYGFWTDDRLVFKMDRFEAWIAARGYLWPRTPTGRPSLDRDVLEDMAKALPAVAELRDVRHAANALRLERLHCDPDGRNRVMLSAFRTITGRNAPKASQFIYGPARWLRHLIVAPPDRALAYVDWSGQEAGVMAALSGDLGLLADYASGDPYLAMAIRFGRAPAGATKATHGPLREVFKTVALATSYGMGPRTFQTKLQSSHAEAEALLATHRRCYRPFWRWSDGVVDVARLQNRLVSSLGWPIHVHPGLSDRTLRNWPVQACGAEMMRWALVQLHAAGVTVAAVVHDAFLIEASAADIAEAVATTRAVMAAASRKVLRDTLTLRTDAAIIPPGGRYQEPRGRAMWERALGLLEPIEEAVPA